MKLNVHSILGVVCEIELHFFWLDLAFFQSHCFPRPSLNHAHMTASMNSPSLRLVLALVIMMAMSTPLVRCGKSVSQELAESLVSLHGISTDCSRLAFRP